MPPFLAICVLAIYAACGTARSPGESVAEPRSSAIEELLGQLAQRFEAHGAIAPRAARAKAIAAAHVVKKSVQPCLVSAEFLADEGLRGSYVRDEQRGATMLIRVVELAVDDWTIGGSGSAVVVVWPATVVSDPRKPVLPAVGDAGLVFLAAHPDDVLGRELATAFPGSFGIDGDMRLVQADPSGTLRAALAMWGRADAAEAARAVPGARGVALQLALDVLVRVGDTAALNLLRGDGDPTRSLLVRAALWQLGARDDAVRGLGFEALTQDALTPLGVARIENAGHIERFRGPLPETPIAW